jgi:hypothetical protein
MKPFLADVVLFIHFTFVTFVVGGLAAIWVGAVLRWRWTRNFAFRITHLAAICFVAVEALAGAMCPLTIWEDALRDRGSDSSFIARWIRAVMFYEFPEWVFTLAYVTFALIVVGTFCLVPPRKRSRNRAPPSPSAP